MTTVVDTPQWLATLRADGHALPQSPLAWLNERRAQALERANALSVPTTRDVAPGFCAVTPLMMPPLMNVLALVVAAASTPP